MFNRNQIVLVILIINYNYRYNNKINKMMLIFNNNNYN